MKWFRKKATFANVISMCALFVALGGVSYAALKLPKNSVGTKQIKKNAVRTAKGDKGDKGDTGDPGTAAAFARVGFNDSDPTLRPLQPDPSGGRPPQVKNIVQDNVVAGEAAAATGTTCFDLDFAPASAMVVVDNADAGTNVDQIATVA